METPTESINEQTATILIIDDELDSLRLMVEELEEHGYDVLVAQDGQSALNRAHHAKPDLILLDVILPDMDGFDICHQLKSNPVTESIPIIFLTVLTIADDKIRALHAGAADYIVKPIHWEVDLARIQTHLRLHQLTQQSIIRAQQIADLKQQIQELQTEIEELRGSPGTVRSG